MTDSLIIKDGEGNIKSLEVESGSYGYKPVHIIESINNAVIVDSINTAVGVVSTPAPIAGIAVPYQILSSYFSWMGNPDDGTYIAASYDLTRKGLTIFNPGPYNVYVGIATDPDAGTTNGFIVSDTSSAPDVYSFILYPSGTYIAEDVFRNFMHGIYFITGAVNPTTLITATY